MAVVLIVVDEPDTMLLLRRDLEARGHRALLAADADAALQHLATLDVDLVIVDVMMPVRDGWTVLEAIRDRPDPFPAIVISRGAGPADLARATQLGAVASLAMPFTESQLQEAVTRALLDQP